MLGPRVGAGYGSWAARRRPGGPKSKPRAQSAYSFILFSFFLFSFSLLYLNSNSDFI
jgi:hypothetical protein